MIWTPTFRPIPSFIRCMFSLTTIEAFFFLETHRCLTAWHNSHATDLDFCSCLLLLAILLYSRFFLKFCAETLLTRFVSLHGLCFDLIAESCGTLSSSSILVIASIFNARHKTLSKLISVSPNLILRLSGI